MSTTKNICCSEVMDRITGFARAGGAKTIGVADIEALMGKYPDILNDTGAGFTRAVVIGMRLQKAAIATVAGYPTPAYFHNYRQVNYQLDSIALAVADMIQDDGYAALAIAASQLIARNPQRGHISHKLLGYAAGLGFIGRSSLLIHPLYGAQMRYVSVLTDMPLPAGSPIEGSCGSCMNCVEACPAGAIHEAPDSFNLDACFAKLSEFTRIPFTGQHICGICLKACPGNMSIDGSN